MEGFTYFGLGAFLLAVFAAWFDLNQDSKQQEFRIRALERLNDKSERITHVYHHTLEKGKGVHALLKQTTHL